MPILTVTQYATPIAIAINTTLFTTSRHEGFCASNQDSVCSDSTLSLYCTPLEPILASIPTDFARAERVVACNSFVRSDRVATLNPATPRQARRPAPPPCRSSFLFFCGGGEFLKRNGRQRRGAASF